MRHGTVVVAGVLFSLFFVLSITAWAVPALISYQGQLEDAGGPVTDDLTLVFRLFDSAAGGTPLWEESQAVIVEAGVYNVILGAGTLNPAYGTLAAAILSGDELWLEVQVVGEADPMSPRQPITSVGFAIRAGTVSDGAITATKLASDAVTTAKLVDGAVTAAKVNGGAGSGLDADLVDGHSAEYFGTAATDVQHQAAIAALQDEVQALKELLQGVTRKEDELYFEGMNVHVRNGAGQTDSVNKLGNLIVGYNEDRSANSEKSGSHNLIVGPRHNYSSYGGLVAGSENTVSNTNASVVGGSRNAASGRFSVVSGGYGNDAVNQLASVSGGRGNTAGGDYASVSGGYGNTASGRYASVSGGQENTASGDQSSASGGSHNTASGDFSSAGGGRFNEALGTNAVVLGGGDDDDAIFGNKAYGDYSVIVGGWLNETGSIDGGARDGNRTAILGGEGNHTVGLASSASGGRDNTATGDHSSVSGGQLNAANGSLSSVTGGFNNVAGGATSAVSGGANRSAPQTYNWAAGALSQSY